MRPIQIAGESEIYLCNALRDVALRMISDSTDEQIEEKLGTLWRESWERVEKNNWEFELGYRVIQLLGGNPNRVLEGALSRLRGYL